MLILVHGAVSHFYVGTLLDTSLLFIVYDFRKKKQLRHNLGQDKKGFVPYQKPYFAKVKNLILTFQKKSKGKEKGKNAILTVGKKKHMLSKR